MIQLDTYKEKFLKGDNTPLKELYIEYHDDMARIIKAKRLCDPEKTEDFINDAFIQFYEKIVEGALTEVKSVKNYLIGICVNLKRRDTHHKLKIETKIDEIRLHMYNNYDYTTSDDHNSNLIKRIKSELSKLTDRCQEIIVAYYIDGLTMKEIGTYLNLSSGDVAKTLKSRCFKTLLNNIKSLSK